MAKKHTKKALFTSVMSLVLCCAMLVGTTFAWFTDSVTSGNNIIKSGNLDVELYHKDKGTNGEELAVDANTMLFDDQVLWEPGALVYETLKVKNAGTLALKYNLNLNVLEESVVKGYKLSDVIMVGKIDNALDNNTTRVGLIDAVSEWIPLNAFNMKENGVKLEKGQEDEFTVILYWAPNTSEIDNHYNVKDEALNVSVGVTLVATQVEAEQDSFGEDYDAAAKVPGAVTSTTRTPVNSDGSASLTVINAPAADTKRTTVDAPAGTFDAGDEVEIEVSTVNTLFNVTSEGGVVASLDVTLKVNGTKKEESLEGDAVYTVTTYISKNLNAENVKVEYTGNDGKAQPNTISYDPETGKLVFTTNHFSNYAVSATALAYDPVKDRAVDDIVLIVEAAKNDESTVVIPDVNKTAVSKKIEAAVENGIISEADKNVINNNLVNAVAIGDASYVTLAEAWADAQDGDTIVVLNDIATSDAIINTKKITLDLNGKTITGTDNATGSFGLITNKGTLTVKDSVVGGGAITLKATNNRGWNAYSSVISNTVGGKLIVESGTIEHLGGTDMAYGIDNLTNGKGTNAETIINGGTVKSPYRAIRMFLNGTEADNILTVNGGTIEGANKSIWMQDPSANANTGTLTVGAGAVLNGDVYLFVTAGSEEWPVNVSIAASAVNGKVLTGNVPEGYSVVNSNGTWVVLANTAVVATAEELVAALEKGMNVVLTDDVSMEAATTAPYGNKYAVKLDGGVLDGNGNELYMECYGDDYGIMTSGGTVKNLTIKEGCRAVMIMSPTKDIILDNVNIGGDGVLYPINTGEAGSEDVNLFVTNSTLAGWTSYSNIESASFTNVTFKQGTYYNNIYGRVLKPYVNTTLTNCSFVEHMNLDLSNLTNGHKITMTNCTVNGQVVTANVFTVPSTDAEYDTALFTVDLPSWASSVADCIIFG